MGRLWSFLEDQGRIFLPHPKVTSFRNPTQTAADIPHLGSRWSKGRWPLHSQRLPAIALDPGSQALWPDTRNVVGGTEYLLDFASRKLSFSWDPQ